jgi:hypothetical protein
MRAMKTDSGYSGIHAASFAVTAFPARENALR